MWYWGLESASSDLAVNLARDEALLESCEALPASSALRFWEHSRHAVVLGASSRIHDDVHLGECERAGIVVGRRGSGGGTVLLGPGALNVAIVLPIAGAAPLAAVDTAQTWILYKIAQPLRSQGFPIVVQGSGDWTIGDRKVAGSAQRRLRRHLLVHLSILYDFDLSLISRYIKQPKRQPAYRGDRAHDVFLANLRCPIAPLINGIRSAWGPNDAFSDYAADATQVERIRATKYGDPAWVRKF